jgi:hypothetical protein
MWANSSGILVFVTLERMDEGMMAAGTPARKVADVIVAETTG